MRGPLAAAPRPAGAAVPLRRAGGRLAALAGVALLVVPAALRAQPPAILSEAPLTGKGVEFHAVMHPDTVYVGQQANYQVGVFLGDDVRARLRRNPEFVPPEMAGVLGYDLPVTHVLVPDRGAGRYEAHVFERAIFPLTAGSHEIPAARLSYSLPLNRSFFSREESFLLRTAPVRLVALPAPIAGRPADYDGAIGSGIDVDLHMDSGAAARVGDPLLLTVRVAGRGNVNLFPRPRLDVPWATAVATGERVTLDTTTRAIGGTKEFDWLITPKLDGEQHLPAIRYPYFDPERATYLAALAAPETVRVAVGALAALDTAPAAAAQRLAVREQWRGPLPRPPAQSPVYWLAVALMPLPSLFVRFGRRRRRPVAQLSAAARLSALDAVAGGRVGEWGATAAGARSLRALFIRALAERLALPALPVGDERAFVRALRLEGVSAEVARDAATLLVALDRASYAVDADLSPDSLRSLTGRAQAIARAVDAEARRRPGMPGAMAAARRTATVAVAGLVILGGLGAALLGATTSAGAAVSAPPALTPSLPPSITPARAPAAVPATAVASVFAEGVTLYRAGNFRAAHASFAAVAARVPRAPDAWANAGTAAWAAGDSAGAAIGWQRAVRLEPTARDVRDRLALLPGDQLEGAAAVPPLSQAFLQWLALVAWGAASALALWSVTAAGGPLVTVGTAALVAVAVLGGGGAAVLGERLAARDLAVVAAAGLMRDQPALAASTRRPLAAGEVVRVRARTGVWTRIEAGPDAGWVERSRLRELRSD